MFVCLFVCLFDILSGFIIYYNVRGDRVAMLVPTRARGGALGNMVPSARNEDRVFVSANVCGNNRKLFAKMVDDLLNFFLSFVFLKLFMLGGSLVVNIKTRILTG